MAEYKILLVDDEENIISSLERTLRGNEYSIMSANSAEEASNLLKKYDFDLIICDYKLGQMNGIDFLAKVSKDNPEIVTILLTGHADLKMAVEAVNKAALYRFILKPWDNDDLRITVRRALEQRELVIKNKFLINEIRKRDLFLEKFEKEYPGITKLKRDSSGRIILD